jgi:UDP-3-O-[3-hydroxymyristoyl] glucosamine N-acyltransferase
MKRRKVAFSRGSLRDEPTDEMACRSRALVRAAREATRPHAWRVRGTRGLASSPAARARVDPTASVHPRARLASDAALGPFCVVSAGAVVGPGCRLGAGVHLLGDVELGAGCVLRSHAVVGAEVRRAPTRREDAPPT